MTKLDILNALGKMPAKEVGELREALEERLGLPPSENAGVREPVKPKPPVLTGHNKG